MTAPFGRLQDLFDRGPWEDLMVAGTAHGLLRVLSERRKAFEAAGYALLFRRLSYFTGTGYALALCRMFEQPSSRYQQRTVTDVLECFADSVNRPARPTHPDFVRRRLAELGAEVGGVADEQLGALATSVLREALAAPGFRTRFDALKDVRDKRIAHNEEHEQTQEQRDTPMDYFDEVLQRARDVVETIRFGFLGLAGELEGRDHPRSGDPERVVAGLEQLLRSAGIVVAGDRRT